jgi:hypothetical protein
VLLRDERALEELQAVLTAGADAGDHLALRR